MATEKTTLLKSQSDFRYTVEAYLVGVIEPFGSTSHIRILTKDNLTDKVRTTNVRRRIYVTRDRQQHCFDYGNERHYFDRKLID
jgi:hypothetical protein